MCFAYLLKRCYFRLVRGWRLSKINCHILSRVSRVFSSVGLERYLDRVEVVGSNPSTPTRVHRDCESFFVSFTELLHKFLTFSISISHHGKDMSIICYTYLIHPNNWKKRFDLVKIFQKKSLCMEAWDSLKIFEGWLFNQWLWLK